MSNKLEEELMASTIWTVRDPDDRPSAYDIPAALLPEAPTYPLVINRLDRNVWHYTGAGFDVASGDKVEIQVSNFIAADNAYRRALPFAVIYPPEEVSYGGSVWGRLFSVTAKGPGGWNSEVRFNTSVPGSPDAWTGGGDENSTINWPTGFGDEGKAWIFEFSNTGLVSLTLGVSVKISEVGNLGNNATTDISKLHTLGTTFTLAVGNVEGIFYTPDITINTVRSGVTIDSVTFTVA